jgi:two-component sensor histidine kinase
VNAKLTGPKVLVEPRTALALGMATHELITNAVKFGALSNPDGKVDISWTVQEHGSGAALVLKWVEQNGPRVTQPSRRGFGMTLIERAFAHDVEGEAEVMFLPEGVVATLIAPLPDRQERVPSRDERGRAHSRDKQNKETP